MKKLFPILVLLFSYACMFFGGPEYDSAADSTGLRFDGLNDYILIEENVIPDSGDYTISVWLKADSGNTGARTIVSQSDTAGSPFYFGSNSASDTSGTIKMTDEWKDLKSKDFYMDNNWHYYTIVNDGTIGDSATIIDTSALYIDGVLIAKSMGQGKSYPTDEKFFIATMWDNSGEYFSGLIDGVSIWDRKLTPDEVSSLYNSGVGMDPTVDTLNYVASSNLIGFWPFNEGADSSVTDYSGSGYDGQIIGASWVNVDTKLAPALETVSLAEADDQTGSNHIELWGRVTDGNEKSLYQASISLTGYHNEEFQWNTSVLTNRRGNYEIIDCQPWDNLKVSLDGYKTQVYLPSDSIFSALPADFVLEEESLIPAVDSSRYAELAQQAEENYELIQQMINSARQNEVISIPQGVHTISRSIVINRKTNITIQGILSSGIILSDIHQPVFIINNSSNIVLQRLSLGHDPSIIGDHDSEVLRINEGNNIYINSCEISGDAAIGVKAIGVQSLTIVNCFVHDNSWFAFSFQNCDNVKVEHSRIIENQEVMYKRSSDVAMYSNIIKD